MAQRFMGTSLLAAVGLTAILATPIMGQRLLLRRPFEKGSLVGSGGFSYSSSGGELFSVNGKRTTLFSFNPSLSYFVTSGLAAGVQGMISTSSRSGQSSTSLGIGPEVSYYFRKRGDKSPAASLRGSLIPYVGGGFIFVGTKGSVTSALKSLSYRAGGTRLDLGAGVLYMFSDGYGVFLRASYEFHRSSIEGAPVKTGNRVLISGGFSAFQF